MRRGLLVFLVLVFVFSLAFATSNQLLPTRERIISTGNTSTNTRDILWQDTFEGEQDDWTTASEWYLVDTDAYSPTHSWWTDDAIENAGNYNVDSPIFSLPADWSSIKVHYWYLSDLVDYEGDGDGYLDDYWEFSIMSPDDAIGWHQSTENGYDGGSSWYAGNDITGEYGVAAAYYMYTPVIDLTGATSAELTCMLDYDTETPGGEDPPYDGWDVANIQISTDGWATYEFLEDPANPYNVTIAYAGYYNSGNPADTLSYPGWGGASAAGWFSAAFDLSAYAGNSVEIRFVLDSDPYTPAGGFWVDNVDVTVDGSNVFTDYDEANLLPDAGIVNWERLDYDYDVTGGWTQSTEYDITGYAGKDIALRITARIDDNMDGGDGGGFWFDDVTVVGSNLPPYDGAAVYTVVPYPATAGVELHPMVVYGNMGLSNINPNLRVDVDGLGAAIDYLTSAPGEIATGEYGIGATDPLPTFALEAGTYDWIGSVVVGSDADESNNAYTTSVEVLPAGQYQLGYNSRVWDGTYTTSSICGTYFTPYTDGVLTDAIDITAAQVMLLNNSTTDNPTESITVKIWEAIDDVTPGALIYEESFNYTAGLSGEVAWAELTLSEVQTLNADFFVTIDGDFTLDGAEIVPVFDNMVRQYLGAGAFSMNTVYYDPDSDTWGHSSGDRFINVLAVDSSNDADDMIPNKSQLLGNYPNPFNPKTEISFQISEVSNVTVDIYNVRGEKVKSLVNDILTPATYSYIWDGTDNQQNSVGSGVYFYKMKAGRYTSTKKMILMK